jgi:hypothetical protein
MFYNRILGVWMADTLDCFIIGAIIGSLISSYFKIYLGF